MDQKPDKPKKRLTFLQAAAICGVVIILLEVFKNPELDKRIRKFEQSGGGLVIPVLPIPSNLLFAIFFIYFATPLLSYKNQTL